MKELVWDNTLSIGVDEVDEDHRRLVDLFNIFNRSVAEGDAADYVQAVLEELISLTVWHFRHEERLMLKYGYAGLAEHKAEHQELIESVQELQQKYLQGGETVSEEDIQFLEQWLTAHIYDEDMKLGNFLTTKM